MVSIVTAGAAINAQYAGLCSAIESFTEGTTRPPIDAGALSHKSPSQRSNQSRLARSANSAYYIRTASPRPLVPLVFYI